VVQAAFDRNQRSTLRDLRASSSTAAGELVQRLAEIER
jgi:hypothetical protein